MDSTSAEKICPARSADRHNTAVWFGRSATRMRSDRCRDLLLINRALEVFTTSYLAADITPMRR